MFTEADYPDLLVGLSVADDAAVWQVDQERALIFTLDFFTPIVDDPFTYGAIAATNALSDVYAMGGAPFLALNIAAFPAELPEEMIAEILRGSAAKVKEAGAIVAGGHTVDDDEPKFGLAVLGYVHPQRVKTKAAARPGDTLVLTKPLGTGIISTAFKAREADSAHMVEAVRWMLMLNKYPAEFLAQVQAHAITDITGFGLIGHAWEVASKSEVRIQLRYADLPFHPGAADYADLLLFPAGANRNLADYAAHVQFDERLTPEMRLLTACPETSGGLLVSLPPQEAEGFLAAYRAAGYQAWQIGKVLEGPAGVQVL
jgi:selenide,water dikinase